MGDTPRTVVVLANGDPPPAAMLRAATEGMAYWCCDGAVAQSLALGVTPDLVLGDMDSVPTDLPAGIARLAIAEQETTDLEKAFYTAVARSFARVVVLGAGGGRWDQFHGNLSIAARYADRLAIEMGDAHGWLAMLAPRRRHATRLPPGRRISLLALPRAERVTIVGVRWPLHRATLALGERDAVSNEVTAPAVRVVYGSGCLALYVVSEPA